MVNAGALVTTDLVSGKDPDEKLERILHRLRSYAGNDSLAVDWDIFDHEMRTADRNRGTAYLMRSEACCPGMWRRSWPSISSSVRSRSLSRIWR